MQQEYLNALERKADSDKRVLAAWLEGSLAKDTADRYSDVDIHLLVAPERKAGFQQELELWLSDIQPLVLFSEPFPGQMITGITEAGLRLDVWVHSGTTILLDRTGIRVLYADEGSVRFKDAREDSKPEEVASELARHFNEFWRLIAILPTVLGREERIAGFMGTTFVVMSLTEVLIIGGGKRRDRGVKNVNAFLPQEFRTEIEAALTMKGIDGESLAKAHLRLAAMMQRCGPNIAKQHGINYPFALEKAVVGYVTRELQLLGLSGCLNELHRR